MPRNLAALVIGNAAYAEVPVLLNPVNDADDISGKLGELGFAVQTLRDASIEQMGLAVADFGTSLETSSVGLVFFAGHAFQIDSKNYLAAVDTRAGTALHVQLSALDLDIVLGAMRTGAAPTCVVILDACRNNPFEGRTRSGASNQLASISAPKGTLIAFSTSPGQTASDGNDRNGYYTQALLQHIDTPNIPIETMFKRVRSTLESLTDGRQTSWEHTSLTGDFRFERYAVPGAHGYGSPATADSLFPRSRSNAGILIEALKTYNWYTQNPAIEAFTIERATQCTTDELFVVGRNIYQAACGSANAAITYIRNFADRTALLDGRKRKAVLDGMLYEIFFDSLGQHRAVPKNDQFESVFELQAHEELADSFTFIRGALIPFATRYVVLPGSNDPITLTVTVVGTDTPNKVILTGIWLDATDFLRPLNQEEGEQPFWGTRSFTLPTLRRRLSEELVIPERLLIVEPQVQYDGGTSFKLPGTHTISAVPRP